jgi:hypothetical protein
MTKIKINNNKYLNGAGILIFEKYNNEWSVLLFKDYTKTYSDIGGTYEFKHGEIRQTALEELMEESRNLFKIKNKEILKDYIDIKHNLKYDNYYRLYIINISDNSVEDFDKYYKNNKKIIDSSDLPYTWKETTKIKRFYLKDLLKLTNKEYLYCKDIFDKNHKIRHRVKSIMIAINKINKFTDLIPSSISKKKSNNYDRTITFNLY